MVAAPINHEEFETVALDMLARRGPVLGLYTRMHGTRVEVWLVTQPLTPEQELNLYAVAGDLREKLPNFDVRIYVEHSGMYEGDVNPFDAVPLDARRHELPAP